MAFSHVVIVLSVLIATFVSAVDITVSLPVNNNATAVAEPTSTLSTTTTASTTTTTTHKSMFANNNDQPARGAGVFEQQQEQFYRTPVPCKPSMRFGFGDALENPCKADPEGNPINFYNMRLIAAVVRSAMPAMRMPQPNLSKDVPNLVTRVGRILNPDAPRDVEAYKRVYERMMQFNGESSIDDTENDAQVVEESGPQSRILNPIPAAAETQQQQSDALPTECCPVRVQVVYPQFGQSAVSDKMFTIIQDFPNFVQPVYKRVCVSDKCNFLRGNCTQKFTPQAVFSASLSTSRVASAVAAAAPVPPKSLFSPLIARALPSTDSNSGKASALFGQDYILVESGCECRPDFFSQATYAPSSSSNDDDKPFS